MQRVASGDQPQLKAFFRPSSAALVGATEDLKKFGGRLFKTMLDFGYERPIYAVNPSRSEVFGRRCYRTISDVPEPVEHVGVIVPAPRVLEVLEESSARGTRFATVLSGGYAETGTEEGLRLQRELTAFGRRSGMRIMGPNCNGFVSFVDGFAMTNTAALRAGRRAAGNVGLVAHSGGLGQINVMWRAQEAGLGISYQVSCGNEADLDAIDFAQFMIDDPATDVIMMALEGVRSGRRFMALAEAAAECGKPLVALKFGRTEAGARAASSHTGAITGADDVYDAVFRQFGVIRVTDCNELYEVAKMLRTRRRPRGVRAAAITGSGGHAVLVADLGASVGLEWVTLSDETERGLRALLPSFSGISNPIDLTSAQTGAPALFTDALRLIARDPAVDVLIPVLVIATVAAADGIVELHASLETPMAVLWTGFCSEDATITPATLVARGVPTYRDAMTCVRAVRASLDYARFLEGVRARSTAGYEGPRGIDTERARELLGGAPRVLGERECKALLAHYGFRVTRERLARSADEAVTFAAELGGKVALKIESADIPHKTEAHAIRLSVEGADEIRTAYRDVLEAARVYKPDARIAGVLVQEMVPAGVEMMLGLSRDPVFGSVITVASGGVHVEVFRDVAHGIPPISRGEIGDMLARLRSRPLLDGVRGAPGRDVAALTDALERLSWLAVDFGDRIAELDINPLVVLEKGAGVRVVDALLVQADDGVHRQSA